MIRFVCGLEKEVANARCAQEEIFLRATAVAGGSNVVAKSTVSTPQIPAEEAQLVKHRKMHAGILRPLSPLHIHAVL